jgi:Smg protein
VRIYTGDEMGRLDTRCRGFLIFLEQVGVLDGLSRELVIDRVMALEDEEMDLDQLKWVVLMVLFNQPGRESAYAWMEDLVIDHVGERLN